MMITMSWMSHQHAGLRAAMRCFVLCFASFVMSAGIAPALYGAEAAEDNAAETTETGDHDDDHSDGEGEHAESDPVLLRFDVGSAVCNLLIFLGVLGILSKFVWPVILDGLQAREDKIFDELKDAEKAKADAQSLLADYQGKLDGAAVEVQSILSDARNDATASGQRIVDEAKEEAERQRERANAEIETAKKVALAELAGQTSDLAIGVAQQVIGRELKAEDHAELIRQSLDRLPSNN